MMSILWWLAVLLSARMAAGAITESLDPHEYGYHAGKNTFLLVSIFTFITILAVKPGGW